MFKKVYSVLSNSKIAVIGFFLVLIPCIILSYLDYQAIGKRTETIRSNYEFTLNLIRDKIEQEIISKEEKLQSTLNGLTANNETIKYLKAQLFTAGKQNQIIINPFFLNSNGGVITSQFSKGWRKSNIILPEVSKYILSNFNAAGKVEFVERNYNKAARLYEKTLRNADVADSVIIFSAMGRCYFKAKDYNRAIKTYKLLLAIGGKNLNIGSVPSRIAALTQMADIYSAKYKYHERFKILLQLYNDLINNPWNVNESEYNFYLNIVSAEIRKSYDREFVNDSTNKIIAKLKKRELNIFGSERFAEFIRKNIFPRIEQLKSSQQQYESRLQNLLYINKDSVFHFGYLSFPNAGKSNVNLIFGFQINQKYIFKNMLPEILSKIDIGNNILVGIMNDKDSLLFSQKKLAGKNYLIAENFSKIFPSWKIALFDREGKTIDQQIAQEKQQSFLILGLNVLVMLLGIIVLIISARHEYQISRLKSDFVSNVSHELKTPLSIVRMFSETLESEIVTDKKKQHEFYGIIKRESERLTALINNLLDFSRIEKKKKEFHFKDENIVEVLRNVVDIYKPQLTNSGFKIECILPEKEIILLIDRDAISQAVLNLMNNAVKYSGDRKFISVELHDNKNSVIISIKDCGIGIPEKEFENIFENFYRISTSETSNIKGTGLGLTIAKYIVEAHKGTITVESKVNEGSKFTITFPTNKKQ